MTAPLKDLKASLSSSYKPDITHVRSPFLNYTARSSEYGNDKYERANYQRAVAPEGSTGPTRQDVERFRAYLRAAAGHIFQVLDALEKHQANDPFFDDVEGFKKAAYAVDTDTKVGDKIGPSLLPHVAPACASLNMAITQAANCGLLPADPGCPWRDAAIAKPAEPERPKKWLRKYSDGRAAYYMTEKGAWSWNKSDAKKYDTEEDARDAGYGLSGYVEETRS